MNLFGEWIWIVLLAQNPVIRMPDPLPPAAPITHRCELIALQSAQEELIYWECRPRILAYIDRLGRK